MARCFVIQRFGAWDTLLARHDMAATMSVCVSGHGWTGSSARPGARGGGRASLDTAVAHAGRR